MAPEVRVALAIAMVAKKTIKVTKSEKKEVRSYLKKKLSKKDFREFEKDLP
jgi:hypothetical protein